jgi:hypothetical protein
MLRTGVLAVVFAPRNFAPGADDNRLELRNGEGEGEEACTGACKEEVRGGAAELSTGDVGESSDFNTVSSTSEGSRKVTVGVDMVCFELVDALDGPFLPVGSVLDRTCVVGVRCALEGSRRSSAELRGESSCLS